MLRNFYCLFYEYQNLNLKKCEEILDIFNLVLARKQADVEVYSFFFLTTFLKLFFSKQIFQQIARIAREAQEASKSSWWGWATSSSSSVLKEDQDKISEAVKLSKEEKGKLYDAIGYTEGEEILANYPENVFFRLDFSKISKFKIILIL